MDKEKNSTNNPINEEAQKKHTTEHKDHGGFFWAFFLIALGVIFLLNNLEILPWSIWGALWRLWPLFLIIGGIQIIFGRSKWMSFFISLFCFCILMIALIFGFTDLIKPQAGSFWSELKEKFNTLFMTSGAEITDNYTISDNELSGITKRKLKIELDSSNFTISSSDTGNYLELISKYYENIGVPEISKNINGGELDIEFKTEHKSWDFFNPGLNRRYDFTLGRKDLETELDLNLVSGKSETVLNGMKVTNINSKQVSGSGVIDISAPIPGSSSINIDMTSGSMVLNLPEETKLKLNYEVVSGSLKVDGQVYQGKGSFEINKSISPENDIYVVELNLKMVSGNINLNLDN